MDLNCGIQLLINKIKMKKLLTELWDNPANNTARKRDYLNTSLFEWTSIHMYSMCSLTNLSSTAKIPKERSLHKLSYIFTWKKFAISKIYEDPPYKNRATSSRSISVWARACPRVSANQWARIKVKDKQNIDLLSNFCWKHCHECLATEI